MRSDRAVILLATLSAALAVLMSVIALNKFNLAQYFGNIDKEFIVFPVAIYTLIGAFFAIFPKEISSTARRIMQTPRVVILHNPELTDFISGVETELAKEGIAIWNDMSDMHAGDEIFSTIKSKIADADAVIFFTKENYPSYLKRFVQAAIDQKVRVIPVVDDANNVPDNALPYSPIYQFIGPDKVACEIGKAIKNQRSSNTKFGFISSSRKK